MKLFCLRAHAHFQAEDINDALEKLGDYFILAASQGNGEALTEVMFTPTSEIVVSATETVQ